jgi:hypothetical protein
MTINRMFRQMGVITLVVALATLSCEGPAPTPSSAPPPTASTSAAAMGVIQPGKTAVFEKIEVGPGDQTILFETGATPLLNNLKFVMGGKPSILIERIRGTKGTPDIPFADGVPPYVVTRMFAQNPIITSVSANFDVRLRNTEAITRSLEVVAIFDD